MRTRGLLPPMPRRLSVGRSAIRGVAVRPDRDAGEILRAHVRACELAAAVLAGLRHERGGARRSRLSRLVLAPVTVSVPVAATELVVLVVGLLALLALNLVLLRPAFRPLDELAETMRRHDPLSPGERARVDGGAGRRRARADVQRDARPARVRAARERAAGAARPGGRAPADRARAARRGRPDADRRDAAGRGPRRARSPTSCASSSTSCARPRAHGTEDVRRIARRLRPEALEDLGLQSALAALATAFGEQARRPGRPAPASRRCRSPRSRSSSSTASRRRR